VKKFIKTRKEIKYGTFFEYTSTNMVLLLKTIEGKAHPSLLNALAAKGLFGALIRIGKAALLLRAFRFGDQSWTEVPIDGSLVRGWWSLC
tara:strand:- start:3 stop:272 length:270 start_codon:yes stop_codon:yes gene_type:complete